MSWVDEHGEHELYISCVFPDGMSGSTTSSRGIEATIAADGRRLVDDESRLWRSEDEVSGWLVCCDCRPGGAWSPSTKVLARWQRVRPPEPEDPARGRLLAEGCWAASSLSDRDDVAAVALRLWATHRAPAVAELAIADAAQALHHAGQQLDDAVLVGRTAGLSWVDVGRAVGITRQSARERWGSR